MAIYWKRKYRGMGELEPWYLLTNLPNLPETIKAYKKRVGIEAMFKYCQTGGDNLEGAKASIERLTRLVWLIAIAIGGIIINFCQGVRLDIGIIARISLIVRNLVNKVFGNRLIWLTRFWA